MMRDSLTTLLLILFSSLSFNVCSAEKKVVFTWSGKVPHTPPMVIIDTTKSLSTEAIASFKIIYTHSTPLTYSIILKKGEGSDSERINKSTKSADVIEGTLSEIYKFTIFPHSEDRVIYLNQTISKHEMLKDTLSIITVSSII